MIDATEVTSSNKILDELILKILNNSLDFTSPDGESGKHPFQDHLVRFLKNISEKANNSGLLHAISNFILMIECLKKNQTPENQYSSVIALLCLLFTLKANFAESENEKKFLETHFSLYIPPEINQVERIILNKYKENIETIQRLFMANQDIIETAASNLVDSFPPSQEKQPLPAKPAYEQFISSLLSKEGRVFKYHEIEMSFIDSMQTMLNIFITTGVEQKRLTTEEYSYSMALKIILNGLQKHFGKNPDLEKKLVELYLCIHLLISDTMSTSDNFEIKAYFKLIIPSFFWYQKEFSEDFKYVIKKINSSAKKIAADLENAREVHANIFDEDVNSLIGAINTIKPPYEQLILQLQGEMNVEEAIQNIFFNFVLSASQRKLLTKKGSCYNYALIIILMNLQVHFKNSPHLEKKLVEVYLCCLHLFIHEKMATEKNSATETNLKEILIKQVIPDFFQHQKKFSEDFKYVIEKINSSAKNIVEILDQIFEKLKNNQGANEELQKAALKKLQEPSINAIICKFINNVIDAINTNSNADNQTSFTTSTDTLPIITTDSTSSQTQAIFQELMNSIKIMQIIFKEFALEGAKQNLITTEGQYHIMALTVIINGLQVRFEKSLNLDKKIATVAYLCCIHFFIHKKMTTEENPEIEILSKRTLFQQDIPDVLQLLKKLPENFKYVLEKINDSAKIIAEILQDEGGKIDSNIVDRFINNIVNAIITSITNSNAVNQTVTTTLTGTLSTTTSTSNSSQEKQPSLSANISENRFTTSTSTLGAYTTSPSNAQLLTNLSGIGISSPPSVSTDESHLSQTNNPNITPNPSSDEKSPNTPTFT